MERLSAPVWATIAAAVDLVLLHLHAARAVRKQIKKSSGLEP